MTSRELVDVLMEEELASANQKHPEFFASDHEAYAVIKEEYEEAYDELLRVQESLSRLWTRVKHDKDIEDALRGIKNSAYFLTAEAIQIYAMAEKGLRTNAKISL